MADQGRQNLPNLKICVDNTEEGEISESDESSEGEAEIQIDDEETLEKEDTKDVEFNLDAEEKPKQKPEVFTKKYENRDGDFITGMDLTSKEAMEKKEERAKRFGIEVQDRQDTEADIKDLYTSLDLKEEDFNRGERGVRPEAIHVRGTNNMSTQDVFRYFKEYAPGGVEWIDDSSCNAVWADPTTAARALLKLSASYESAMKTSSDKKKSAQKSEKKKSDEEDKTKEEKGESEENKMEVEEYDDDLDLMDDDKEDGQTEEEGKKSEHAEERDKKVEDKKDDHSDPESKEKGEEKEEKEKTEKKERKREKRIPWPPGKWRLGYSISKSSCIFLRFATKADRKLPRAESRSKYYVKYGNPNYGGMKGLISTSRKKRYRMKTYEEELAETKAAIESQREAREAKERGEEEDYPASQESSYNKVSPLKRKRGGSGSEGEELDMEAELQELLGPPIRKQRSMRMYADDEEEKRNTKKRLGVSSGVMTVVAGSRQPVGKVRDARELIQRGSVRGGLMMDRESPPVVSMSHRGDLRMRVKTSPSVSGSDEESEQEEASEAEEEEEEDSVKPSRPSVMSRLGPADQDSGETGSDSGSEREYSARLRLGKAGKDLRSRLGSRKTRDNRKYPSMRIEVFD